MTGAVERAAAALAAGRPVVVVDAADREDEGDLVLAGRLATAESVGFLVRHTSGYLCAPAPAEVLDRLDLPPMVPQNEDRLRTAYAVAVDAADGVGTGISAADRARTVRVLADPGSAPADLVRPGHLLPLRARTGGVLTRPGHTEATVDLLRIAAVEPVGVIGEIVDDLGEPRRGAALRAFAEEHDLVHVTIAELVAHRRRHQSTVERAGSAALPTRSGAFVAHAYRDVTTGVEHLALVHGDLGDGKDVLVRLHSECLTGDVLGSRRCDCGAQLDDALERVVAEGRGVVVYLRGHEGRGIGLAAKVRAYALQEQGLDTVEANLALGFGADERDHLPGAHVLHDLGVRSVRLLTHDPRKVAALRDGGVEVLARIDLPTVPTAENLAYLRTKAERMGHEHDALGAVAGGAR